MSNLLSRIAMRVAYGVSQSPRVAWYAGCHASGREIYNIDALCARFTAQLDEAKLVQLDRLRVGQQRLGLRELGSCFAMPAGRSSRA
jgi:hypothetical protein